MSVEQLYPKHTKGLTEDEKSLFFELTGKGLQPSRMREGINTVFYDGENHDVDHIVLGELQDMAEKINGIGIKPNIQDKGAILRLHAKVYPEKHKVMFQ